MSEIVNIVAQFLDIIQAIITNYILPQAGVGGDLPVHQTENLPQLVKFTVVFALGIAALFGIGLAMAAQKFAVKVDPRIDDVKGVLAGAHCGACGFPGCEQYAEAVVNDPNVPPNLCTPGGARAIEAVARITGKVAEQAEPIFSRIMCQGSWSKSLKRFKYEGVSDCRAAVLAGGGDKSCVYGCLGYGTCEAACPFDAIHMNEDNWPVVDMAKCTGCRKCEKACPKKVIEILPASKAVIVACHSKDKGGAVRKHCEVGCIACGKCVKVCPFDAPIIENNVSRIDLDKCKICGICVQNCPTNAIIDFISTRAKAFITDRCIGCHKCAKVCPVDAPAGELKQKHVIDQAKCIGCGICTAACPKQAIEGTFNAQEVMEAAAAKKAAKEADKEQAA